MEERALIAGQLAEDERRKAAFGQRFTVAEVFTDWRIWALALADFSRGVFNNALNFWMPTLVQELGVASGDYFRVGLLTMIPWGVAALAMVLCAWNSDRTGDRMWHAMLAALAAFVGLLVLAFAGRAALPSMIALTLVASGGMAWLAVFWTLPTQVPLGPRRGGRDRVDQRAVAAVRVRWTRPARAGARGERGRYLGGVPRARRVRASRSGAELAAGAARQRRAQP